MDITYLGHSCFKLKGSAGTVVMDPYYDYVGLTMPSVTADVITISHQHKDHNASQQVKATSRRDKPFLIDRPGEYEVADISVFGVPTWHDGSQGTERGQNIIFTVVIDTVSVCHLGDLGHELNEEQIAKIGSVDVLLCPVGGVFTINPIQAIKVIQSLDPAIVIPMHFKTPQHDPAVFGELQTQEDFLKEYGLSPTAIDKLSVDKNRLPEETEVVTLLY